MGTDTTGPPPAPERLVEALHPAILEAATAMVSRRDELDARGWRLRMTPEGYIVADQTGAHGMVIYATERRWVISTDDRQAGVWPTAAEALAALIDHIVGAPAVPLIRSAHPLVPADERYLTEEVGA